MANKINLFIDCDPGHDDAVALMMALSSSTINLLGVGVSSGNQTLLKTAKNAIELIRYLGFDTPICLGEAKPLVRQEKVCAEIHGESGIDGVIFPFVEPRYSDLSSARMIIELSHKVDDLRVAVTGPCTNLAKAIILDPTLPTRLKEIVIMGGSIGHGNVTPAAEFNICCDPEAAEIVFNCKARVVMMGLDVTRKVLVLPSVVERMQKIGSKSGRLFTDLMRVFNENQKAIFGFEGGPLHDPVTIIHLLNDKVVTLKEMSVVIDVTYGPSAGRTNCDQFDFLKLPKNAWVAVDIDVNRYFDEIEAGLRRLI